MMIIYDNTIAVSSFSTEYQAVKGYSTWIVVDVKIFYCCVTNNKSGFDGINDCSNHYNCHYDYDVAVVVVIV